MSPTVNTKGLPKAAVFKALYDNAIPLGMGHLHYIPGPLSEMEANAVTKNHNYFDYYRGRVMKVSLENPNEFESYLYDRDNPKTAQSVIDQLRTELGIPETP